MADDVSAALAQRVIDEGFKVPRRYPTHKLLCGRASGGLRWAAGAEDGADTWAPSEVQEAFRLVRSRRAKSAARGGASKGESVDRLLAQLARADRQAAAAEKRAMVLRSRHADLRRRLQAAHEAQGKAVAAAMSE